MDVNLGADPHNNLNENFVEEDFLGELDFLNLGNLNENINALNGEYGTDYNQFFGTDMYGEKTANQIFELDIYGENTRYRSGSYTYHGVNSKLSPFFYDGMRQISDRLWLPFLSITDAIKERTTNYVKNEKVNCWFSTYHVNPETSITGARLKTIQTTTPTTKKQKVSETCFGSKEYKLNVNRVQRKILVEWMEDCNVVYNDTLDKMKDDKLVSGESETPSREKLRTILSPQLITQCDESMKRTPSEVRKYAMMEAVDAVLINEEKLQKGTIGSYEMKHREIKLLKKGHVRLRLRSIRSEEELYAGAGDVKPKKGKKKMFYGLLVYPRYLKKPVEVIYNAKEGRPKIEHEPLIVKRGREYYLKVPSSFDYIPSNDPCSGRTCSIDPGARDMGTFYSPCGMYGVFGHGYGDVLLEKNSNKNFDLVLRDFHIKVANWLCDQFDIILFPKLEVARLLEKCYSQKQKEMLCLWKHYQFRNLLIQTGKKKNKRVIIVDEAHTSMTCGCCFHVKKNLGSAKVFKCAECGYEADRDMNAARNILLLAHYYSVCPPIN